jgi:hypothetical protein
MIVFQKTKTEKQQQQKPQPVKQTNKQKEELTGCSLLQRKLENPIQSVSCHEWDKWGISTQDSPNFRVTKRSVKTLIKSHTVVFLH